MLFPKPVFSQYAEFQVTTVRDTLIVVIKSFSDLDKPINVHVNDSVDIVVIQVYMIQDTVTVLKPLSGYNGLAAVINYLPKNLPFYSNLTPVGAVVIGVNHYRLWMDGVKRRHLNSTFIYELNGTKSGQNFSVTLIF